MTNETEKQLLDRIFHLDYGRYTLIKGTTEIFLRFYSKKLSSTLLKAVESLGYEFIMSWLENGEIISLFTRKVKE